MFIGYHWLYFNYCINNIILVKKKSFNVKRFFLKCGDKDKYRNVYMSMLPIIVGKWLYTSN